MQNINTENTVCTSNHIKDDEVYSSLIKNNFHNTVSKNLSNGFFNFLRNNTLEWYCSLTSFFLFVSIFKFNMDMIKQITEHELVNKKLKIIKDVPDLISRMIFNFKILLENVCNLFSVISGLDVEKNKITEHMNLENILEFFKKNNDETFKNFHEDFVLNLNISNNKKLNIPVIKKKLLNKSNYWQSEIAPYMWCWVHFSVASLGSTRNHKEYKLQNEIVKYLDIFIGCSMCAEHYRSKKNTIKVLINLVSIEEGLIMFHLSLTNALNAKSENFDIKDIDINDIDMNVCKNKEIINGYKRFWSEARSNLYALK